MTKDHLTESNPTRAIIPIHKADAPEIKIQIKMSPTTQPPQRQGQRSPRTPRGQSRGYRGANANASAPGNGAREKHYVQHNYHDHSRDPVHHEAPAAVANKGAAKRRKGHRGGVAVPFPEKLHFMLGCIDGEGMSSIVRWQPHGRCFMVHKPKEFLEQVMPKYFRQSKLTSFQRQLNLYGFSRLTTGPDRGGYYHELFIRGRMDLCKRMVRTRVKGNGCKAASSPQTEPDFYKMEPCQEQEGGQVLDVSRYLDITSDLKTCPTTPTFHQGLITAPPKPFGEEQFRHEVVSASDESESDRNKLMRARSDSISSSVVPTRSSLVHVVSPTNVSRPCILTTAGSSSGDFPMISIPAEISFTGGHGYFDDGAHSGDKIFFEGLPFHYLESNDIGNSPGMDEVPVQQAYV